MITAEDAKKISHTMPDFVFRTKDNKKLYFSKYIKNLEKLIIDRANNGFYNLKVEYPKIFNLDRFTIELGIYLKLHGFSVTYPIQFLPFVISWDN